MMTKTKQKVAGALLALLLSLGLGVTNASAIQFVINNGNDGVEPDQDFATVDITFNSGTIHVAVNALAGFGIFGNGSGNGAFGFNVVGTTTGIAFANITPTGGATGCAAGNGGQFNGWGNFELSLECGTASNNITSLSFDLTRVGLAFTGVNDIVEDNAGGNDFAAHICRREDGETTCATTGFATTGGGPGGPGGGPGGATTATGVPEPSTFMLVGAGLLIMGRRMSSKKE